ncbi:NAD-dependent epimerase/dehydratase family protein [Streptomyces malaysiensis]|uniref:NAD-dependent epimerase/dehydratase family protein n=1 Tax=Streptomyces malaysiensis subsp. samsunensis TaxID=459658 RepID=A0A9X2M4U2_STRMQ|nr:NAD-dependent epimerase/dehydratase family protein [Streptomyces samsunensis]MCQ8835149.1 NAD-dependent epimerase/dehydratase family protein [Streptomyces samsunensis]
MSTDADINNDTKINNNDSDGGELVLVTGGNGYVGTHVISRLLRSGHRVRTTVRSHGRAASAEASVRSGRERRSERTVGHSGRRCRSRRAARCRQRRSDLG